ncbi:TrmH family RNA methyltransferase [Zunongwangia endophytica]|uniref:TrmH family RNA methyltransferase n=1 Tax=Zunongwangia endophytica TaxID=1808945 RepID=A0ABV8HCX9_9FLAO|nr:TrmH family RNA methyltransferase [Zunongwangia endophytica]MDN3593986.1 TrmH family RNA methyltransferase [Zunongwangia endophytica]
MKTDSQLNHSQNKFSSKKFPVTLVLDQISGEANIGSIFRLSDAFHVEEIIFCGIEPNLNSNRLKRTSRSTHEYVEFQFQEDSEKIIQQKKEEGYKIIALEITENSIPLQELQITPSEKIVLIAGHENFGISENILSFCDKVVHINMFGNNSSMNVAQSVGISLYEITKSLIP